MTKEKNLSQPLPDTQKFIIDIDGDVYETYSTAKFDHRKEWKNPDKGEIRAQIAGTIRRFFVKVDAPVKRGDKLLILEAMKMHNEILSPIDGVVKALCVAIGQNVAKGDLLINIEAQ